MVICMHIHVHTAYPVLWPFFQLAVQYISIFFQHLVIANLVAKTAPLDHGLTLAMACAYTCTCMCLYYICMISTQGTFFMTSKGLTTVRKL